MTWMRLSGHLTPEGEFHPGPAYPASDPDLSYESHSWTDTAVVEVLGKSGDLRARVAVPVEPVCLHPAAGGTAAPPQLVLAGLVPLDDDAARVAVHVRDTVVHEIVLGTAPPVIEVDWSDLADATGDRAVRWHVAAEEGVVTTCTVLVRPKDDPSTQITLAPWASGDDAVIPLDELPGGTAEVVVCCSDGRHVVEVVSEPIDVPMRGSQAAIYAPGDGAVLDASLPARLWGAGWYAAWPAPRATCSLVWWSSLHGELGEGAEIFVPLGPGEHLITLVAGTGEREGKSSVAVTVAE